MQNSISYTEYKRFNRTATFNPMMMSMILSLTTKIRRNGGFRASDLLNKLNGLYDGFYYTCFRDEANRLYSHDVFMLNDLLAIADTMDVITENFTAQA